MRTRVRFALAPLMFISIVVPYTAFADVSRYQIPEVESFTASPSTIDLTSASPTVTFELNVTHPLGIYTENTKLWFKSKDERYSVTAYLQKTGTFLRSGIVETTFKGSIVLPNNFESGLYDFYAEPVEALPAKNSNVAPKTQNLYPTKFNDFPGGEKSVAVRIGGDLNLKTKTFVGPSYNSSSYYLDSQPRTLFTVPPITKVNEIYNPTNYFEQRVPNVKLEIESFTPKVCKVNENILTLNEIGLCDFRVFTRKTQDYIENSFNLSFEVTNARWKPTIQVPIIANQTSLNLPKSFKIEYVYSNSGDVVYPISITPKICVGSGQNGVTIISGGICTITYQTKATSNNLESDIYRVSFEITREPQNLIFTPSNVVNLSNKTLNLIAKASSDGLVTFSAEPSSICTVTGNTLNLLKAGNCAVTAQQAGTTTIAPISKTVTISITGKAARELRTISCVKGSKKVSVTKAKPKCPKGYSRLR